MFSGQQKSTPMFVFIARFFLSYYKVIKKFLWHKKKRAPHPFFVKCYLFKKDVPPSNDAAAPPIVCLPAHLLRQKYFPGNHRTLPVCPPPEIEKF